MQLSAYTHALRDGLYVQTYGIPCSALDRAISKLNCSNLSLNCTTRLLSSSRALCVGTIMAMTV